MTRMLRNLSLVLFAAMMLVPAAKAAPLSLVSCEHEDMSCSRRFWDFEQCADSCADLLAECISNCGGQAPYQFECQPPGFYNPPNKKDGHCYCINGPCPQ